MKKMLRFATIFIILILGSCVSKKKYVELQSVLSDTKNREAILLNTIDTLNLVINKKDTLIDSLATIVVKLPKQNQNSTKSGLKSSKSTLTKEEEYYKKVRFIHNFTRFVSWPTTTNDFIIGVTGGGIVLDQLQKFMSEKTVGNRKIVVQDFKAGVKYDLVYVTSQKARGFDYYKTTAIKTKALLVADEPWLYDSGAHIVFTIDKNNILYKANKPAIEKIGLKVAKELMNYSE